MRKYFISSLRDKAIRYVASASLATRDGLKSRDDNLGMG
jgi:hypothetical protein